MVSGDFIHYKGKHYLPNSRTGGKRKWCSLLQIPLRHPVWAVSRIPFPRLACACLVLLFSARHDWGLPSSCLTWRGSALGSRFHGATGASKSCFGSYACCYGVLCDGIEEMSGWGRIPVGGQWEEWAIGWCRHTQCGAMPNAARCDSRCSALQQPTQRVVSFDGKCQLIWQSASWPGAEPS